jgi:sec-independent protein translocase protein TatC
MTDISSYLDFVVLLFFAFGIAFETPVATVLLVASGLVSIKTLKKNRGYVLLGIFVVAAFLTPPDAIAQTAMAVPMYLLYEVGILLGAFVTKDRVARRAKEEAADAGE